MMHDRQRPSRHHQLLLAEHFSALVRDRSVGEDLVVHRLGLLRSGGEHRPCRLQPGVAQRKVLLRLLARDRADLVLGGAATQPVHAVVLPAWDYARWPHLDCKSDAFRVSETDSEEIEKVSPLPVVSQA